MCQHGVLATCRLLQCEPAHTANGNLTLFVQSETNGAAFGWFGQGANQTVHWGSVLNAAKSVF